MIILLLAGIWILVVVAIGGRFLLTDLKTGVLKGKRGHRTYREQSPGNYWFGVGLTVLVLLIGAAFGWRLISQALMFATEGS